MRFLCDYLNELVILSDGAVTTCCMDSLGVNRFASIYHESPDEIIHKYKKIVANIVENPVCMPRCKICYSKISAANFPETGMYKINPTDDEIFHFMAQRDIPWQLVIEMSSICNLACNGCMQSRENIPETRKQPLIDSDMLTDWVRSGTEQFKYIRLYNYGETFIHPGALDFIEYTRKTSPKIKIEIATNGLLLNTHCKRKQLIDSNVHSVHFSIHGSDTESVQKYMTSAFDFKKMMSILKDCSELKQKYRKDTHLIWKYLLFEWNDSVDHINRAKDLAKKAGMDRLIFVLPGFPSPSKRFSDFTPNTVVETVFF